MTTIKYGMLKIGSIHGSSGVFIGTNVQSGRKSEALISEGFGTIRGKNHKVMTNKAMLKKNNP